MSGYRIFFRTFVAKFLISMNLEELEKRLVDIQDKNKISISWLKRQGISSDAVSNIREGRGYRLTSLFKYVELLGYFLVVDNCVIEDIKKFGETLQSRREKLGLSLIELSRRSSYTIQQLKAVELGNGYYRSSLVAYLSVVSVDFDIMSAI